MCCIMVLDLRRLGQLRWVVKGMECKRSVGVHERDGMTWLWAAFEIVWA
jgi:hypothetical protein